MKVFKQNNVRGKPKCKQNMFTRSFVSRSLYWKDVLLEKAEGGALVLKASCRISVFEHYH